MAGLTRTRDKSYWESRNPVLPSGVIGFESETGRHKLGDGTKRWNDLTFVPGYTGFVLPGEKTAAATVPDTSVKGQLLALTRRAPYIASMGPATMDVPTISAVSETATLPVLVAANTRDANSIGPARGAFSFGGSVTSHGNGYPDNHFIRATRVNVTGNPTGVAPMAVSFWYDGSSLELCYKGLASHIVLRINGQVVTPGISVTQDGGIKYHRITFPDRRSRWIHLETANFAFGGVMIGATDSVWPAPLPGPRCIVVGDSFTEGTGATYSAASNWVRSMADHLGWPDTWSSGLGGTGYLNPNAAPRVKFRDRFTTDVTANQPDVILFAGGINDHAAYSKAAISAEATALFDKARTENPKAFLIVSAPFWRNGPSTYASTLMDAYTAIRDAAISAGALFIDPLFLPLDGPALVGQITTATPANATTVATDKTFPIGANVKIGNDYRQVLTTGGGTGANPQKITVRALSFAYPVGTPIVEVGRSFWTGTGRVGNLIGDGNSDVYVGTDGTHPTQVGHNALGVAMAHLIHKGLTTQTI